jgi:hypothetical protein
MLLTLYQGSLLSLIIPLDLFFFQRTIVYSKDIETTASPPKVSSVEIKNPSKYTTVTQPQIIKDLIQEVKAPVESNPYSQCSPQLEDVLAFTSDNLGLNHLSTKDTINYNGSSQN